MKREVEFFSGGTLLAGDLYLPDGAAPDQQLPGVVLCCGYTGIKDLYLNVMGQRLAESGFAALTFDFKGWGKSGGAPLRLAPYSRVEDAQAALTYLAQQSEVAAGRLGIYGVSYGGSIATYVAAIDPRVLALVSVTGVGDGPRWMRSVRRPWEYRELVERGARDWQQQVVTGTSEMADRAEVLMHDPQSAEIAAQARKNLSGAAMLVPLEFVHETLSINPEWIVDRIAPRASLFITSDADELVPPDESIAMFERAGEPRKLVVLRGFGHYQVFVPPALDEVILEATDWYRAYLA